ncbi:MAG: hypothetical protein HKP03_09530 [Xanthomonadales bacterium]|nr:hypothetical protein [Xanthomonadales bacterium]
MFRIIWPVCGVFLLATTQSAFAAKPLGPPIEEMLASPELTRVAAGVAREKLEPPRVRFEITDRFSGESPDELALRLDDQTYSDLTVGQTYIFAWTDQRKVALLRKVHEIDPDGPSVVSVRGLSTKALYEDSPEIRSLLTPRNMSSADDAAREIDALLAQMKREDVRSRDLVVAQLFLKPELSGQMSRAQADTLRQVLNMPGLSAQHRDNLLQSALRMNEELRTPWLAEEYRRVIILHGARHDLNSFVPGLVKNSAKGLGQIGEPADVELLSILLYANNPGVARVALRSMDRLDRAAAVARAEQAVERGWVAKQTRRELEKYLENGSKAGN